MSTSALKRSFWHLRFQNKFLLSRAAAFQDFFSTIMETRHPEDFQRVRPWGSQGDQKNDGYLKSTRTIFQVYAPNELKAAEALAKIHEDFFGCLPHWEDHFDCWTFVHNAKDGLGPEVLKYLLQLNSDHTQIDVRHWGYEELRRVCFSISDAGLEVIFGSVPDVESMMTVGYEEIQPVIQAIARTPATSDEDLRPVSADKIQANMLSPAVQQFLHVGMVKANIVAAYLRKNHDPQLGDRVAARFKSEYESIRSREADPDLIFGQLLEFASGTTLPSLGRLSAVLAVLAHLFEECVIFERPAVQ